MQEKKLCGFCKNDACEKCQVTLLINNAYAEYDKIGEEKKTFQKEQIKMKEYCYDGQKINCPDCGEEITIEHDTARCDSCG